MSKISIEQAIDLVCRFLVAHATAPANARSVARSLVLAEADGQPGHGFSRLASYAAQLRCGKVYGHATPTSQQTAPSAVAIDAAFGFAYPALDLAVAELIPLARQQGVAAAGVRRSHHCGAMSLVVEQLADAGLVALMVANTPAAIAPWGGRRALFGTNPIACAFPHAGHASVVIDLSVSKVARGKVLAAKQRGEAIPEGWALDAEGQPTTDAGAALAGTMLPLGDAKGTALALMVEALAAGLTGSTYAADASSFLDEAGGPPGTGQLLVAFSPGCLGGNAAHMARLFQSVADEPGARLPGSRRQALRQQAVANGIKIPASLLSYL